MQPEDREQKKTTYSKTALQVGLPETGHRACGGEGEASFPDHMEQRKLLIYEAWEQG